MTQLTVVIPSFNEGANVRELLDRLANVLSDVSTEVLYVDDSTDDTPAVIAREAQRHTSLNVRCIHRAEPTGRLAGAVIEGIAAAESPVVVVMDADLQHPPETVADLYRTAVLSDADVVVASRYVQGGSASGLDGAIRRFVSTWSGRVAKALFPRRLSGCTDPMSGFFAVRRDAVRLSDVTQCGYKILLALLLHRRLATAEVPFTFAERFAGESKASLREGLRFLRLLAMLRTGPGMLFTLMGASGVLPNLAVMWLLTHLTSMHYVLASVIAIQVAIVWNLVGAELIVFRDRRFGKLWQRAVKWQVLSNTDLARLPFVVLLVSAGMTPTVATLITLIIAVAIRYSLAVRLVYPVAATASTSVQTAAREMAA